jgi:hypothetical protein
MAKLFYKELAFTLVGQAFLTWYLFRTCTVLRMNTTCIADYVAHTDVHRENTVCAKGIKIYTLTAVHRELTFLARDTNCMNRSYCGCGEKFHYMQLFVEL